eukprot:764067-Hanusia_phi.AAC.5
MPSHPPASTMQQAYFDALDCFVAASIFTSATITHTPTDSSLLFPPPPSTVTVTQLSATPYSDATILCNPETSASPGSALKFVSRTVATSSRLAPPPVTAPLQVPGSPLPHPISTPLH